MKRKHSAEYQEIKKLVEDKVTESLTLEYKSIDALQKSDLCKNEISKDVSAFANSAGGVLIYGVTEKNGVPVRIDEGVDPKLISKEWIEQVISSRIQRKIDGIKIQQINLPLKRDRVIYKVQIPQSDRAPHQASDHKFYKRQNFRAVSMEEYEIRDMSLRSSSPDLKIEFLLGNEQNLTYDTVTGWSNAVPFTSNITNLSVTPAEYAVINLVLDRRISIVDAGGLDGLDTVLVLNNQQLNTRILRTNWAIPAKMPIFKDQFFTVSNTAKIAFPFINLDEPQHFYIGFQIGAPHMDLKYGHFICEVNKFSFNFMSKSHDEILSYSDLPFVTLPIK